MKLDLLLGDCLDVLPTLEAGSVHCCICSPPYWGLRDYQVDGQLGLEATPEEYVAKMVEVFRAVRRVLRDDGTCWINLGDSYAQGPSGKRGVTNSEEYGDGLYKRKWNQMHGKEAERDFHQARAIPAGLKSKDLVGIPWMVAFALRADGWYLRSDIIWHKPNPMPESCTDRPTKSHEYLFLLTKQSTYYYDAEAIREGVTGNAHSRGNGVNPKCAEPGSGIKQNSSFSGAVNELVSSRNKRSVWTISTQSYKFAHFATFPEALVLPCILAGTSEEGCCAGCGAPWERVVERGELVPMNDTADKRAYPSPRSDNMDQGTARSATHRSKCAYENNTTGWQPTCTCDADTVPCTVLDPFLGSGTTAKVAQQYGRSFIGCELSAEYLKLAGDRFKQPRLFA